MIGHVIKLLIVAAVGAMLFYISRFWTFSLWSRDGLFGLEWLRPQGGLLARWLRGTDFVAFELLIWVVGGFLLLSLLQAIFNLLTPSPSEEDPSE